MPKEPDQRDKESYENVYITGYHFWISELNHNFFWKNLLKLVYIHTHVAIYLTSTNITSTTYIISTNITSTTYIISQWFLSVMLSNISLIPEICQKCKYVGPTQELLGDSSAPQV